MDTINLIAATVVTLLMILLVSLVPYFMGRNDGYREGQIDALNGKIHYKLEKQDDSQFIWVRCPDVCEYEKGE